MVEVLPAIIPHTREQMESEIGSVAPFASRIQVDISDGVFVPTKTWPYNGRDLEFFDDLKSQRLGWPEWERVDIELHLMVKNPETVLEDWIATGITAVVAHIEATDDFQKIIDIARLHSVSVGIAIKPSTDISRIAPFASQVDFIQCMGSDMLGKHGVELDSRVLDKVCALHTLYPERILSIDIGVTAETAEELIACGAGKLIVGSAILEAENPEEFYTYLKSLHA